MRNSGVSYGNGVAHRNWPVVAIERPDAAALADRQRDVALLAARNIRVDPLDELRIGIDRGPHQHSFVRVVQVPVIARQMLVVPDELAGVGIERHGRIAVEIRRRRKRNRARVSAVAGGPGIRHRVGDAPENQPPHRIVPARQSPRRGQPSSGRRASPRLVPGSPAAGTV